ncbi:MAG TPA: hypothetical protein VHW06_16120 [Streptosporangiaceae bacterium]|jgi:hypothetical protein|nr:hypothetical protein [Streptosporangiaceae bacterium]
MRIGICLFWLAVGAIFTFAVTANTSVFNLHVFGVVVMIVALIGLFTPRRGYEWLGRRVVVRRTQRGGTTQVEQRAYPPYVLQNPGTANAQADIPDRPSLEPDPEVGRLQDPASEQDPGEDSTHARTPAEEMATERANTYYADDRPPKAPPRQMGPNDTEVIEDVYEEPPA